MFDRLIERADRAAQSTVERAVRRLSQSGLPDGVTIEQSERGLILSGKRLRRRMIDNPFLRNFWR